MHRRPRRPLTTAPAPGYTPTVTEPIPPQELTFEAALDELEAIVTELERGETPLEDTIARFERGVALARRCEDRLDEADRKVAVLVQRGKRAVEVDLESGEELADKGDADKGDADSGDDEIPF